MRTILGVAIATFTNVTRSFVTVEKSAALAQKSSDGKTFCITGILPTARPLIFLRGRGLARPCNVAGAELLGCGWSHTLHWNDHRSLLRSLLIIIPPVRRSYR